MPNFFFILKSNLLSLCILHITIMFLEMERGVEMVRYNEIGSTGLNRWGNYVYEEFLPQLRYPGASRIYKEMADNDPTVGGILYMMENLVRNVVWNVEPAGETTGDKQAAEFLQECMNNMSTSWVDTINDILSFFTYGWALHEIVYTKRADGRIVWKKFAPRSQHTLHGWEIDDDGNIKAMLQQAPPLYKTVTIPLDKSLLFRAGVKNNNPEGKALLRNAYRPWYFKKRIEEIEGIGIERDLAGLPVIQPPEGVDLWDDTNPEAIKMRNYAVNLVKNVRRDSSEGLVVPFGWDFKLLSTGGSRQFDTNAIISRYDNRIAITMLADIVMLGTDRNGSFALADIKKSLLANSVQSLVKDIANVINENAIKKLFKYNNFPGMTSIPKVVPGEIESPSLKEIGDYIRAAGIDIMADPQVASYVHDIAGIPYDESRIANLAVDNTQSHVNSDDNIDHNVGRKSGKSGYNATYYGR